MPAARIGILLASLTLPAVAFSQDATFVRETVFHVAIDDADIHQFVEAVSHTCGISYGLVTFGESPKISFDRTGSIEELLAVGIASFPGYELRPVENGRYLVIARALLEDEESIVKLRAESFAVKNKTLSDAIFHLLSWTRDNGVGLGYVGSEWSRGNEIRPSQRRVSVDMGAITLLDVIVQLFEQAGPDVTWTLNGVNNALSHGAVSYGDVTTLDIAQARAAANAGDFDAAQTHYEAAIQSQLPARVESFYRIEYGEFLVWHRDRVSNMDLAMDHFEQAMAAVPPELEGAEVGFLVGVYLDGCRYAGASTRGAAFVEALIGGDGGKLGDASWGWVVDAYVIARTIREFPGEDRPDRLAVLRRLEELVPKGSAHATEIARKIAEAEVEQGL